MTMLPELQDKFILVDTCVISSAFRYVEKLNVFFKSFEEKNCHPCINEFIYLEFIRIAKSTNAKAEMDKLLNAFIHFSANDPELFKIAKDIYPLYNYCNSIRNTKQASLVDMLNVAYLSKHKTSLYYITFDNNDFPLELLNRIATGTIDVETQILTWGIYKFNEVGYRSVKEIYNKQI